MSNGRTNLLTKRFIIASVSMFSLILVFIGSSIYIDERNRIEEEKYNDIKAIADLKEKEILLWRFERDSDAKVISSSPFFIESLIKWQNNPEDQVIRKRLFDYLKYPQDTYRYDAIILSDTSGNILLASNNEMIPFDGSTMEIIRNVMQTGQQVNSDLYACSTHGEIHYDIVAPVKHRGNIVGVLLFRMNPSNYLYPAIQRWPTPSKTAETLLLKHVGDSIVFLNELRHMDNTALKLTIPMSRKDVPAIQAVLGNYGRFEGNDYRNVRVLSDIRRVEGTSWYMIAKIDTEEVYSSIAYRAILIIAIILTLISSVILILTYLYRQRQKGIYKSIEIQSKTLELSMSAGSSANWEWDLLSNSYKWPKQMWEMFGYDDYDGISPIEAWQDKVHPDDLKMTQKKYQEAILAEKEVEFEFRIIPNGNEVKTLITRGKPIYGLNNKLERYIGITFDISGRKEQEKKIIESGEWLKTTLVSIGDAVIATDNQGAITLMNPVAENLTGWLGEEAIGKKIESVFKIINESSRKPVEIPINKVLREKVVVGLANHTILISKDGSEIPIDDSAAPIMNTDGSILGVVLIFKDITEKKKSETLLRESEKQYKALFENINEAIAYHIIITDDTGKPVDFIFLDCNPAYEEFTHLKKEDIVGKRGSEILPNLEDYWLERYGKVAITGASMKFTDHSEYLDKYWEVKAFSPKKNHFAVAFSDVTDRINAEQALKDSDEIVKSIPSGLFVYRYEEPDTLKFHDGNPAALAATGLLLDEAKGKDFNEIWQNAEEMGITEDYLDVMRTGKSYFGQDVRYDDNRISGAFKIIAFKMSSNRLGVAFEDITEKVATENALRESQRFNETILDASPDVIYVYDLSTNKNVYSNNRIMDMLGYSPEELREMGSEMLKKLMHQDDFENYLKNIIPRYLSSEDEEIIEHSYRIRDRNGTWRWFYSKELIFQRDESGEAVQIFGIITDISESKIINDTQNFLAQKGWLDKNESFFNALILHICKALDFDIGLLVEVDQNRGIGKTLAYFTEGKIDNAFEYQLKGTPCENVFDKELCIYKDDVQKLFPADKFLVDNGIRSYAGIPLWDTQGKPIGLIAVLSKEKVFNDELVRTVLRIIAVRAAGEMERMKAEQAILETQELLNTVGDIAKIGGWEMELPSGKAKWTKGTYDIVEIDYNDPIPGFNEHVEYYLPDRREMVADSVSKLVETGQTFEFEAQMKSAKGTMKWCKAYGDRVMEDGKCVKIYGTFQDITSQKKIEKALQESQLIFDAFLENSPVYVFFKDSEIRTLMLSKNFEKMLGMKVEDMLGKTMFDLFPGELAKSMVEDDKRILREARTLTIYEELNGKHYETTKFPIFIDGQPKILAGFTIDVTEKKKAEGELQKLAKLESLGILAGGIAHNFKNMLTAMTFSVELAKLKPERADHHLEKISKSIEQAAALATRFQTFSNSGKPILTPSDINQIITDSAEIAMSGSSVTMHFDLDASIPEVLIDDKQINEVFTNLYINADQAMPGGGNIYCRTKMVYLSNDEITNLSSGNYIRIEVEDEGVGIPESYFDEIFTPFFSTKQKGQGLGLSSVFYIIEKHKGGIFVESQIDKGTKFIIYLPANIQQSNDELDFSNDIEFVKNKKILFLDDDEQIIETINEFASEMGLRMNCVQNPDVAIEKYKEKSFSDPYDLVILDLTLKGYMMDGTDVLNKLLEINPNLVAFVFSGHSSKPVVANYEEFGFKGRLEKPFVKKQFFYEIKRVFSEVV
jgi:two-component system cell cycle sensor histidine kinase/response regulator CckA